MKKIKKLLGILIGNLICAFGIGCFIIPNGFLVGGTTGIARSFDHYFGMEISSTVAILNVIMFFVGFCFLGKAFALTTLISTIVFPSLLNVFTQIETLQNLTDDRLLAAIASGLIVGSGLGIVLRLGASTGGMDIPPLIFHKKFGLPVAVGMYLCDTIILVAQVTFSDPEEILYGMIEMLLTTLVLNQLLMYGSGGVQVFIISKEYLAINQVIQEKLDKGSTFVQIQTGYNKEEQKAILCILQNRDLNRLNNEVLNVDPEAFIIENPVREVKGRGFTLDKRTGMS